MNRPSLVLALLVVLPGPAIAQRNARAEQICFKLDSHAAARDCLSTEATQSRVALSTEEASVRSFLVKTDEDEEGRMLAMRAFDKSVAQFRLYRTRQCEFIASLTYGGNGQGDRRYLCEIELNEARVKYLKDELKHAV